MKQRTALRLLSLIILAGLVLTACGGPAATTEAPPATSASTQAPPTEAPPTAVPAPTDTPAPTPLPEGGTLVAAITNDPGQFNPGVTTSFDTHAVADSMYNGLVGLDANANPVPDLAESWEVSDDATAYTFHLARGVKWHDGQPFTSADVKFTFENILLKYHSRTKAGLEKVLAGIDTPDDNTVVFRFNKPYAPLLQRLDVTETPILPKHIYEGIEDPTKAEANLKPVGTGPFVFDSYTAGVEIRLKRNENYFKAGLPHLDEVVFRVIPEQSTQIQALEAGEVDYVWRVPGPDAGRIADSPETDVLPVGSGPGGGYCIMTMTFNLERDVFKDARVRQAFAHAIDRQQIVDQIIFGQGQAAVAPISSEITWAHLADGLQYVYDPAKAESLLDEAGYPKGADGARFKVDFIHFPQFSKYGELLREQLGKVGITLELRPLDRDAAVDAIFNTRDFDTNIISYCNGADPEIGVRRMYVSSNIGNIPFSNGAAYVNPEVDELFDQASATADLATRGEIYRDLQQILLKDLPYWWLVETDFSIGARSNCHDFQGWSGHFAEMVWCESQ
jgi:peptide/nickel transport system substrate-binding protein